MNISNRAKQYRWLYLTNLRLPSKIYSNPPSSLSTEERTRIISQMVGLSPSAKKRLDWMLYYAKCQNVSLTGPIHFEDLEPHRFEDLVRQLIYDYKDWQAIEATGRSGNDDGLDIRAYEKVFQEIVEREEDEEGQVQAHPMEGNLWMIQVKREKEIGPSRVEKIIDEVPADNPPYGYILAASANFSKTSYDTFILREVGTLTQP
jgi:hypothetical protein